MRSLLSVTDSGAAAVSSLLDIAHLASGFVHQLATLGGPGGATMVKVGDGTHEHPTQALLDGATLRGRLGTIAGRRVGIVGDILHNRIACYNVFLLATLGAEAVLVAPPTLLTDAFHRLPGSSQQRYPVFTLVIHDQWLSLCCSKVKSKDGADTDYLWSGTPSDLLPGQDQNSCNVPSQVGDEALCRSAVRQRRPTLSSDLH